MMPGAQPDRQAARVLCEHPPGLENGKSEDLKSAIRDGTRARVTIYSSEKIRILHAVYGMNRAGIETWLMHVLRKIDRERFHMDFLVHSSEPSDFDEEIRSLGSSVIPCARPFEVWKHPRQLRLVLQEHGPYQVFHSHVSYHGYLMQLARRFGVPVRIAHSHNDRQEFRPREDPLRWLFLVATDPWLHRHSTAGLAASERAARALFGDGWRDDPRWRVLPCGVDLEPFRAAPDPSARAELGLPPSVPVIGHVGRFYEQKNHALLIDVGAELAREGLDFRLLLVGDGPLRGQIERRAREAGLAGRVRFAGSRPDVARLMNEAMDVFVFPSLYEGLGLALVEAQASGLPCVVSDVVPTEADVVPELVRRVDLRSSAKRWASCVRAALDAPRGRPRSEALGLVEASPFNVERSLEALERFYLETVLATSS